jgi:protoporphyrinogen oxidase
MDPYNEKVWKRELSKITSGWVAGRVPEAPVDDVLKSSVGLSTEGYQHQAIFYYPREGGFQAITDGIAQAVLERVRLSTPVTQLTRHGEGWRVNGEDFDCVVSTLPLTYMPELVEGMPEDVARCMRELDYNVLVCFLLALDRAEHPDHSWVYLPHPEQGPANRITYMSNYSPGNAPSGRTSFLCEVTWPRDVPRPGEELEAEVVDGMVRAGLLRREEVLFVDRSDVEHAYVVFDHGYEERRRRSLEWLESAGIFPLGRFGCFDYDNSDQCVIKARALAPKLLERARRGGGRERVRR